MSGSYRFRCALVGHKSDVRALSCPSDQFVVSSSRDFTARTWYLSRDGCDAHDGTVFRGHTNYVSAVAVRTTSEGSHWIFTGSNDKRILAYQGDQSEPAFALEGHEDTVCCLAANTHGVLVSGSWDKSVKVWFERQCLATLRGHEAAVWCVQLLPNSCVPGLCETDIVVATGSADRSIRVWRVSNVIEPSDASNASLVATFRGHSDCVRSLALLDDVRMLSASNDASIRAWHVPTGQCVGEFYGHTSYVYSLACQLDSGIIVSSGEDRCVRVWGVPAPEEWGIGKQFSSKQSIPLPCQSAWCVALTPSGDVVVGGSDSVIRVFSVAPSRQASDSAIQTYEAELASSKIAAPDATGTGDLDPNKLPGMDALLQPGKREGQVIVVRDADRSVCYQWSSTEARWVEIGDVVGTGQSKLSVYNGKEYDFVFSVDLEDGAAPLKLPYNRTDDPWIAAQQFIHQHELPQDYLDTVAQFIIKNAGPKIDTPSANSTTFVDPFTGADRYIPGTAGSAAPPATPVHRYFPADTFIALKNISLDPLMGKLEAFNNETNGLIDTDTMGLMRKFNFDLSEDDAVKLTGVILKVLSHWPVEKIFPLLDLLRCLVFWSKASQQIFEQDSWTTIYNSSLGHPDLPQANCLLTLRLLANVILADCPKLFISKSNPPMSLVTLIALTPTLVQLVDNAKLEISQRKQHQVALSTLIHNLSVFSHRSADLQLSSTDFKYLNLLPSLCVRMSFSLLNVSPTHGPGGVTLFHPDTVFTLFLALGTALISVTHADNSIQSDEVAKLHRIRLMASIVSKTSGSAEDELAAWESVRNVITYWSQSSTCPAKIRDVAASLLRLLE